MSQNNYSIHSIAAAYAVGLFPHGYYYVKMMANAKEHATNIVPRENLSNLKGRLPAQIWQQLAKARGAHLNAMEGLPLFAAAMLAGNLAKLPSSDLNTLSLEFIGARLLYTALYMGAKSEAISYLRTGVWAWSVSIPIWGLIQAGRALNNAE
ncbi:hypothetical protein IFM51744_03323 [Aspergillus udagawae]|uniref:Uncharacterized protein n=1 Tax=Aspergillus udagawae TaxID=91492 RepID=A0A8H3RNZ1_9EURO|nr:uncharacterized protein Aud_009590 [Aspergillus udagawae]GFF32261.1 hypothetical protein IFM46972_03489 [Aspergillus udagawae]GFF37026.1 hypothetical protein IFM51744_03323 [Aspergillus udagawae]GFG13266.1 hypothetical protein IFM5058_06362 [Aspergillus udagawae]GIC93109.1 hypothetical protein Aud_009590 [Aspergillus udagawae]